MEPISIHASSKKEIQQLKEIELVGIWLVLRALNAGVEFDYLYDADDHYIPTTVIWNLDGTLQVRTGKPVELEQLYPELTDPQPLLDKWPIKAFHQKSGKSWSPRHLGLVNQAYSHLSAEELAQVSDLPLIRMPRPKGEESVAVYTRSLVPGKDEVPFYMAFFNLDFNTEYQAFRGTTHEPKSPELLTILHELGHALSDYWRRTFILNSPFDPKLFGQCVKEENVQTLPAACMPQILLAKQMTSLWEADTRPIHRAIKALPGKRVPPTEYSKSSDEEYFAETFALFHGDPDALQRIDPILFDWFKSGEHVKAAAQPWPEAPKKP